MAMAFSSAIGGSDERKRLGHHMVVSHFLALLKAFWSSITVFSGVGDLGFSLFLTILVNMAGVGTGARPWESGITLIVPFAITVTIASFP